MMKAILIFCIMLLVAGSGCINKESSLDVQMNDNLIKISGVLDNGISLYVDNPSNQDTRIEKVSVYINNKRVKCYWYVETLKSGGGSSCDMSESCLGSSVKIRAGDTESTFKCPELEDCSKFFPISIETENMKNNCLLHKAEAIGNFSLCDETTTEFTSSYAKDRCYMAVAFRLLDRSLCDNIEYDNDRRNCIQKIGNFNPKEIDEWTKVI